ncbi:MAG: hypothetical protein LBR41_00110 [Rickettsiales bacterium]|jgi:hypothetical protein|nr:hypothetical protein [Rickettsiales bacterium]
MKIKSFRHLVTLSLFALCANASAATYYNNAPYQSPQQVYRPTGASPTAYNPYQQRTAATAYRPQYQQPYQRPVAQQTAARSATPGSDGGFTLGAGISHEFSQWNFEMNDAGSELNYGDLIWNIFDVNAAYQFGGNWGMEIYADVKYGMQSGDSQMTDDDVTNGGRLTASYTDGQNRYDFYQMAMSTGTSSGGTMLGINAGIGFTDALSLGGVKITPSVGYRMFGYELETAKNHGLSVETGYCFEGYGDDEIQCAPAIMIDKNNDGTIDEILWGTNTFDASGQTGIFTGETFYFNQRGMSHKYEVSWNGPYFALDLDAPTGDASRVLARVELGLPAYSATGDQPYRLNWEHPKSVEDTAGIGDAYHLGFMGLFETALSDTINFQIGFTYDYYTVSGATAKTYLSGRHYGLLPGLPAGMTVTDGAYYDDIFNTIVNSYFGGDVSAALNPDTGNSAAIEIADLKSECPGWVCKINNEVDSFYKSMGIRIGINARF